MAPIVAIVRRTIIGHRSRVASTNWQFSLSWFESVGWGVDTELQIPRNDAAGDDDVQVNEMI